MLRPVAVDLICGKIGVVVNVEAFEVLVGRWFLFCEKKIRESV